MIYIKGGLTSLNEYINAERTNRYKAAKIKQEETYKVFIQSRGKKIETPCKLKMTWYIKNKRKDADNIAFAKKFVLDGLVKAKVIEDDTMKHIIGFIDEFKISSDEGVKIERVE